MVSHGQVELRPGDDPQGWVGHPGWFGEESVTGSPGGMVDLSVRQEQESPAERVPLLAKR